ncbi:MAG: transglutaminase-like domain-containing protein [Proteobacteria bacterium]|nr:transglutaminase-like domain-containing protein [Cystobacterineae bacterium]MCL2314827.1 transglutaminase-like domain-containing protein [Pseudomonadota bacterium]
MLAQHRKPLLVFLLLLWTAGALGAAPPRAFARYLAECEKPTTEFFGIFLANQKVGYMSSVCRFVDKSKTQIRMETHMFMRVVVGAKEVSREVGQVEVYEAKPKGKLLQVTVLMKGDGGEQKLSGKRTAKGFEVVRERPGMPNDSLEPGAVLQNIEDANLPLLGFLQKAPLQGNQWDWTEFKSHRIETTMGKTQTRFVGGVHAPMQEVVLTSARDKLNVSYWFDEAGKLHEVELALGLRALAQPEAVAKTLDKVDLFNLVRVVLPKALSIKALQAPSVWNYTLKEFPQALAVSSPRQQFGPPKNGLQTLRVQALLPSHTQATFPLGDPEAGKNLEATSQIESKLPAVLSLAKKIVGKEKKAWAAAQKINQWVFKNIRKSYGASADTTQLILQQMKGDCTEHALLATSLLRSLGIPARRVNGLVYAPQEEDVPALYWHQWVEVYVGQWVEMDPTFGEGVASAGHIALGRELEAQMVQGFGQIRIVDVQQEPPSP